MFKKKHRLYFHSGPVQGLKNIFKDFQDLLVFSLARPFHWLNYWRWLRYQRRHPVKKILIVSQGAVGDIITASTAFHALFKHFPKADFTVVGCGIINTLFGYNIKQFIRFDKGDKVTFLEQLKKEKFDLAVNLDWCSDKAATITLFSKAKFTAGSGPRHWHPFYSLKGAPAYTTKHQIQRFISILRAAGIKDRDLRPQILIKPAEKQAAEQFWKKNRLNKNKVIFIHPGAKSAAKMWPKGYYIELIKRVLEQYQCRIVIGWGPSEKDLADEIRKSVKDRSVLLTPPTKSILEFAALTAKADLFIGNCSAPMNAAIAVNTRSIIMMGQNNPQVWSPYGSQHSYLLPEKKCVKCKLPCKKEYICQTSITVDDVFQEVQKILSLRFK